MTLDYLRLTGRDESRVQLVEAYAKAQGLFRTAGRSRSGVHGDDRARPRHASSRAWPDRGVRRIACRSSRRRAASRRRCRSLQAAAKKARRSGGVAAAAAVRPWRSCRRSAQLDHGSVVIAAITSCTNTSNPSVMIARRPASRRRPSNAGCRSQPWVKTSLAPGSKVVTEYLQQGGTRHRISISSASISSATAARPASATAARCRTKCRRRSTRAIWWSRRC